MQAPGRYGGNAGQTRNLHRCMPFGKGAISQLAVVVISPGPDRTVAHQGQGVLLSRRDGDNDPGQSGNLDRRLPGRYRAVAELATVVQSPPPNGAIRFEGEGVMRSCGNCGNAG